MKNLFVFSLVLVLILSGCVRQDLGTLKFTNERDLAVYIDGLLVGSGTSFTINKSRITTGTRLCIDFNFDTFCDWFYTIKTKDLVKASNISLEDFEPECMNKQVRPDLVAEYAEQVKHNELEQETAKNVRNWLDHNFVHALDMDNYGEMDYWSLPDESLKLKSGDCEDWAINFLSLLKNKSPETRCYGLVVQVPSQPPQSVSIIGCNFEREFTIFTQRHGEYNSESFASILEEFDDFLGLNETNIFYGFDDKSCFIFSSRDEVVQLIENT